MIKKVIKGLSLFCAVAVLLMGVTACSHEQVKDSEGALTEDTLLTSMGKGRDAFIKYAGGELRLSQDEKNVVSYTDAKLWGYTGNITAQFHDNKCVRLTFSIVTAPKENLEQTFKTVNDKVVAFYGLKSTTPVLVGLKSAKTENRDADFKKDILSGEYQLQNIYQDDMPSKLTNFAVATTCMYMDGVGTEIRVMLVQKGVEPDPDAEEAQEQKAQSSKAASSQAVSSESSTPASSDAKVSSNQTSSKVK